MRHYKLITIVLIIFMAVLPIHGSERVSYDFEQIGEKSGKVVLRFYEPSVKKNIQVTGYSFIDPHTVYISYNTGTNIRDKRDVVIYHEQMSYPLKVLLQEGNQEAVQLNDLPSDKSVQNHILHLYHRGIVSGYPDGSFKPDNLVTREEIAKMIVMAADYAILMNGTNPFTDVAESSWAKSYILTLAEKGIVSGRGNGKYDPSSHVTIGELIKILDSTFEIYNQTNRNLSYDNISHFSVPHFLNLGKKGIINSSDGFVGPYTPNINATRQDCAVLISRILENVHNTK